MEGCLASDSDKVHAVHSTRGFLLPMAKTDFVHSRLPAPCCLAIELAL